MFGLSQEMLMVIIPVLLLVVEWYLGRTDKVEANSTLSLVGAILKLLKEKIK